MEMHNLSSDTQTHMVLANIRLQLMHGKAIWQFGADKHCGSNMNKHECTCSRTGFSGGEHTIK